MVTENIQAGTLKEWLDKGQVMLIDVREPDEYSFEHIEGAINIPLASASADNLPAAGGKKVVIQCGTGNRSMQACGQIRASQTLYNLEGGLQGWKSAGLKVVRPANPVLPIQRQVQVAVGSLVLAGVILGHFVHPLFLLVAAFMGGGLINAGLTGWCGMAKVLAGMPWNKT